MSQLEKASKCACIFHHYGKVHAQLYLFIKHGELFSLLPLRHKKADGRLSTKFVNTISQKRGDIGASN